MNENSTTTIEAGAAPAAEPAPAQPAAPQPGATATPEVTTAQLNARIDELLAAAKPAPEQPAPAEPAAGKTYTQQEVEQLLAQAAGKAASAAPEQDPNQAKIEQLQQQVTDLAARELRNDAKQALADKGVPEGLLDLVDCTDKAAMEKSVEKIISAYKPAFEAGMMAKLAGKTPDGLGSNTTGQQLIAAQIDKNIRGN